MCYPFWARQAKSPAYLEPKGKGDLAHFRNVPPYVVGRMSEYETGHDDPYLCPETVGCGPTQHEVLILRVLGHSKSGGNVVSLS